MAELICVCNELDEADIQNAVTEGAVTYKSIFNTFHKKPNCRSCQPAIEKILQQTLASDESSSLK